jgi:hypothetical protein
MTKSSPHCKPSQQPKTGGCNQLKLSMSKNRAETYTLVTCHFGDLFWVRHMLSQVAKFSKNQILEVIVVDQSRSSQAELASLPGVTSVLAFEPNVAEIGSIGHDHPSSLNRALATIDFSTTHVLVMDSDCFPTGHGWLDATSQAAFSTVAQDPAKWGLSHPCFMRFPAAVASQLDFAEGVLEVGIDTGRLVGLQLARLGLGPDFLRATPSFNGMKGDLYADGLVYHHGSASFGSAKDARLLAQFNKANDQMFRKKVLNDDYRLNLLEITVLLTRKFFLRVVPARLLRFR